jgi:hypothetical protein
MQFLVHLPTIRRTKRPFCYPTPSSFFSIFPLSAVSNILSVNQFQAVSVHFSTFRSTQCPFCYLIPCSFLFTFPLSAVRIPNVLSLTQSPAVSCPPSHFSFQSFSNFLLLFSHLLSIYDYKRKMGCFWHPPRRLSHMGECCGTIRLTLWGGIDLWKDLELCWPARQWAIIDPPPPLPPPPPQLTTTSIYHPLGKNKN